MFPNVISLKENFKTTLIISCRINVWGNIYSFLIATGTLLLKSYSYFLLSITKVFNKMSIITWQRIKGWKSHWQPPTVRTTWAIHCIKHAEKITFHQTDALPLLIPTKVVFQNLKTWWGKKNLPLSEKSRETQGKGSKRVTCHHLQALMTWKRLCVYSHNKWICCVSHVNLHFKFSAKWGGEQVLLKHTCKLSPCSWNSPQRFYGSAMFPCSEVTLHRCNTVNRPVAGEQHINKDATGDVFICGRWNC